MHTKFLWQEPKAKRKLKEEREWKWKWRYNKLFPPLTVFSSTIENADKSVYDNYTKSS